MKHRRLPQLQDSFQDYLLRGTPRFLDEIVGDARADAATRAAIYHDAYRLRLIEALETDFVALRAWLGEERFNVLARAYIDAHPSDHYSLRYFGRHLPAFLNEHAPWKNEPLLAELARFEWALTDAFDAPDITPATVADGTEARAAGQGRPVCGFADMAAVPPEAWPGLRIEFHPSLQRLDLRCNAPAIWKASDAGERLPAPECAQFPLGWMVWRQELQIYFRSLSVDQAWMLDSLRADQTFAEVCEGLTEWIDAQHVALHAAGLLKQWLEDGLIRSVRT